MKKPDMGYKNLAPMTFSFEESQEIAREVWDAYGHCKDAIRALPLG